MRAKWRKKRVRRLKRKRRKMRLLFFRYRSPSFNKNYIYFLRVLLSDPLSFAWGLVNFLLLFYLSALVEAGTQNRGEVSFEQLLKIQMIPRVKFSIS
ncbi:hypothetical protein ASPWEDRAFT_265126 [Aspergillus wentii DTO 134E9]|uniref:60S ribosomal protein L41 n=1 Tax=Aspergillus wentii DTO 134E9 TaxID=1073089 RepID=A0A1L9S2K5_ASPWE|nr:uncharacterized protein ASPWEDRAFT_265126 [Aspergillus wentii DTO 134E9]OJJ41376.1 hypothetical protein ASPWEDRAFT_265126 [Aspergillus wentii DTO 134E9]